MKFKIYSKQGCSTCVQTKQFLEGVGVEFEYLLFGKDYDMQKFMSFGVAHRTFPLISKVEDDVESYVGTFEDLKTLLN